MHREYRAGESTFGPLPLKSIWEPHVLRDFELRVIMQVAGCEGIVGRLLLGDVAGPPDMPPLEVANYVAKQKGYLPLFVGSDTEVRISEGGEEVLREFFASDEWKGRNPEQTRRW
ncbi:hypothetical protein [Paenarthrobacter sp. NPDC090522]|uniref:hypothetical protein n=1 Tax=Paenarthrobacter sp. NPDC090522 TaxID=3364383 RepID=UPI0037FBDFA0